MLTQALYDLPPADELALIRDEMRRLKIREAVLRRLVLDDPALRTGNAARVIVQGQNRREINLAALPPEIFRDSRYWTMRETEMLFIECAPAKPAISPA
jgi:hypothetical protein